jgi:hypothetical protein
VSNEPVSIIIGIGLPLTFPTMLTRRVRSE